MECALRLQKHRCRACGLPVAAVSNILVPAESSRRLPGWPRNNAAHLEAATPWLWTIWWMGRSFWDVQLSSTTGTQSITPLLASLTGTPPQLRPTGQGFCQGISSSLHPSRDHTRTNLIKLSVSVCAKCFRWASSSCCGCTEIIISSWLLPQPRVSVLFIALARGDDSKWRKCELRVSQKSKFLVRSLSLHAVSLPQL